MTTDFKRLLSDIVQTRAGGAVERCHGIRHQGSYSNAAHTWGVLVLLQKLYPEDFAIIAPYALYHDVPEFVFGDVPAPTMRHVPGLREQLGEYEDALNIEVGGFPEGALASMDPVRFKRFKACDRLDLWLWCMEQELAGNLFARECRLELQRYLATPGALDERAAALYDHMTMASGREDFLPRQAGVAERIVKQVELKS
jgi:hypothetical protein